MVIQFTLQDLILSLVGALTITAGILLIPILWNVKGMVAVLRPLVHGNRERIEEVLKTIPVILENARHISGNMRETTDGLRVAVPVILQEVQSATSAAKGSMELAGAVVENVRLGINETVGSFKKDSPNFVAYINIFEEVLQIIYRTFYAAK